ncbi:MAG: DinB family protein [Bacteroidota bacterium]
MPQKDALIAELKTEAVNTRKMLEKIPEDKFAWKPHEKSMTIGRLAAHVAEIPIWVDRTVSADYFDFATAPMLRNTYENTAVLLKIFEEKQARAIVALQHASDEMLNERFEVRRGEEVVFAMPRKVLIRNFAFNHLIHHRGQLSVYLRLLDVPVPGMYGPSADEK